MVYRLRPDPPAGPWDWRAVRYPPCERYKLFRVAFKEDTEAGWAGTARTAPPGREARGLADPHLAESRARDKAARTVEQRESRLRRHIRPVLGDIPVACWQLHHSRRVIEDARARGVASVGPLTNIRRTWPRYAGSPGARAGCPGTWTPVDTFSGLRSVSPATADSDGR